MNEILLPGARRMIGKDGLYYPQYKIPDAYKERWGWYVKTMQEQNVEYDRLLVKKPYRPRTTGKHSQNAHFNGHVQQLAHVIGYDFDTMKIWVKRKAISFGWPIDTDPDGNAVPWSEQRIDTKQCGAGIDACHWIADTWEPQIILKEDDLGIL